MPRFCLKSFLFFLLLLSFSKAQWSILRTDADSLVIKGTNYIYNVQFDSASACFKAIQTKYPEHPGGYFLDAMVDWWIITLDRETQQYDNRFLNKIDKVLSVCEKALEQNPSDINALFFKGGALGYRGRFFTIRENWLKAAKDGKEGFDILLRCLNIAPGNHDIMLGTGIYNYFAAAIPEKYPILNPLTLFLPKGDKQIGILQLKAAGNYARYAAVEAKVVLLQIYYEFENNTFEAMKLSKELFDKYPNNPFFQRYLGRCYVSNGLNYEWDLLWRDVLNRYLNKKKGYDRYTAREALYYVALALMYKGQFDMSLKYFYKCDEACRAVDKELSGFMVKLNVNIGKIYDMQGKREYAIMQYKKVLSWKDIVDSHGECKQYLLKPYGK